MTGRVIAALIMAAAGAAAAHAAPGIGKKSEEFFKGLACRNAQVFGGQNDIGAILHHEPAETRLKERGPGGNPFYTLSEGVQPLDVFRILPPQARTKGNSRQRTVFSSGGGMLGMFDDVKRSADAKLYWSRTDDLVVWRYDELWWADGRAVRSGFPFSFERVTGPILDSGTSYMGHIVPEHFARTARRVIWSTSHRVAEFEPRMGELQEAFPRTRPMSGTLGDDQLAWTQTDLLVRLTKMNSTSTNPTQLEIVGSDRHPAGLFAPLTFPSIARLLLVRDNPQRRIPEALLRWRNDKGVDYMGVVRLGTSAPTIVARGYIKNVFTYPDRTRVYGYSDHAGRFHPLSSEQHEPDVSFWLEQFERMDGVEEFYLLDKAKYAVVKRNSTAAGPEAVILERRGSTAATLEHLCQTSSPIEKVIEGPNSFLFIPKGARGNELVVYLHDGPFTTVGKGGDWITDMLVHAGTPVLAVNYFGSSSRLRELAVARDIAPMLAADVDDAVAFAREKMPTDNVRLTFLAQGFGAFVGFSSMMAGAARPEKFITISGTTARSIYSDHTPHRDALQLNYLSRAGRQLGSVMNPAEAARKGTRFLFIHGAKDERAQAADIVQFVRRLNESAGAKAAELSIIEGMGRIPEAKTDYREIVAGVARFLGTP